MYLVFDTETTGFINRGKPLTDPSQPKLVELAAILCDRDLSVHASMEFVVHPTTWEIPTATSDIHGITTEIAQQRGFPQSDVLRMFIQLLDFSPETTLVAHNISFDLAVLIAALHYEEIDYNLRHIAQLCTMKTCAAHYGGKWPKLEDAYRQLCGEAMPGKAHNAMSDTKATLAILRKLNKLGYLHIGEPR